MRARVIVAASAAAALLPVTLAVGAATFNNAVVPGLAQARDAAPVVMTGAQIPAWAAPAAQGVGAPYPSGSPKAYGGDGTRSAHNGTLTVPPTPPGVTQVDPQSIVAYSWTAAGWQEIPVQVDERFPYFLANGHSSFGVYSGTDEELTYAWAPDRHDTGEEAWKKVFGDCTARMQRPGETGKREYAAAVAAGVISPPTDPGIAPDDYTQSMPDPQPLFDTDDELSFMARDAGAQAPSGQAPPSGLDANVPGQVVTVTDPLDPTDVRYAYLFSRPRGSSFTADTGYVQMIRDDNADQWVDQYSFDYGSPDAIGISNHDYGPNLQETVCVTGSGYPKLTAGTAPRASTDANPRDGMTVTTPTYQLHADGRWLVKSLEVRQPDSTMTPNIIARWKGRAFQQSPDSNVSLVGFEDEQVNWEMNSSLLGWRDGPVRAIREIWGADSGTNVTKTEYYYRDADVYAYHVRVHPIPPDGLYTDWDYRPGVATTYYNLKATSGVPIDGRPDGSNAFEIDSLPGVGNAEVNSCDPTFDICTAIDRPEEVAGNGFGLVYEFELTGATAAAGNVAAVPYYRDDACFDDGTGDAPVQRPWPGQASTDNQVRQGYVDYWLAHGMPDLGSLAANYAQLKCQPGKVGDPNTPPWQVMPFQGAIAEHGIHFFVTQDSDNTFNPKNTDELDGQQWRFEVPMQTATNVLLPYGANVSSKLVAVATPIGAGGVFAHSR